MDSELRTRISGIVNQLAQQEHQRLRAAGTFVELEELACQIGDEVTRQLMACQLTERSNELTDSRSQSCPDCGQASSRAQTQHRQLDSLRGTIEYVEPAYHCPTCRRAFFPGSRLHGLARQSHHDSIVNGEDRMGWSNLGSYAMAEQAARQLAEQDVSAGRIRRQVKQVGDARLVERERAVAPSRRIRP